MVNPEVRESSEGIDEVNPLASIRGGSHPQVADWNGMSSPPSWTDTQQRSQPHRIGQVDASSDKDLGEEPRVKDRDGRMSHTKDHDQPSRDDDRHGTAVMALTALYSGISTFEDNRWENHRGNVRDGSPPFASAATSLSSQTPITQGNLATTVKFSSNNPPKELKSTASTTKDEDGTSSKVAAIWSQASGQYSRTWTSLPDRRGAPPHPMSRASSSSIALDRKEGAETGAGSGQRPRSLSHMLDAGLSLSHFGTESVHGDVGLQQDIPQGLGDSHEHLEFGQSHTTRSLTVHPSFRQRVSSPDQTYDFDPGFSRLQQSTFTGEHMQRPDMRALHSITQTPPHTVLNQDVSHPWEAHSLPSRMVRSVSSDSTGAGKSKRRYIKKTSTYHPPPSPFLASGPPLPPPPPPSVEPSFAERYSEEVFLHSDRGLVLKTQIPKKGRPITKHSTSTGPSTPTLPAYASLAPAHPFTAGVPLSSPPLGACPSIAPPQESQHIPTGLYPANPHHHTAIIQDQYTQSPVRRRPGRPPLASTVARHGHTLSHPSVHVGAYAANPSLHEPDTSCRRGRPRESRSSKDTASQSDQPFRDHSPSFSAVPPSDEALLQYPRDQGPFHSPPLPPSFNKGAEQYAPAYSPPSPERVIHSFVNRKRNSSGAEKRNPSLDFTHTLGDPVSLNSRPQSLVPMENLSSRAVQGSEVVFEDRARKRVAIPTNMYPSATGEQPSRSAMESSWNETRDLKRRPRSLTMLHIRDRSVGGQSNEFNPSSATSKGYFGARSMNIERDVESLHVQDMYENSSELTGRRFHGYARSLDLGYAIPKARTRSPSNVRRDRVEGDNAYDYGKGSGAGTIHDPHHRRRSSDWQVHQGSTTTTPTDYAPDPSSGPSPASLKTSIPPVHPGRLPSVHPPLVSSALLSSSNPLPLSSIKLSSFPHTFTSLVSTSSPAMAKKRCPDFHSSHESCSFCFSSSSYPSPPSILVSSNPTESLPVISTSMPHTPRTDHGRLMGLGFGFPSPVSNSGSDQSKLLTNHPSAPSESGTYQTKAERPLHENSGLLSTVDSFGLGMASASLPRLTDPRGQAAPNTTRANYLSGSITAGKRISRRGPGPYLKKHEILQQQLQQIQREQEDYEKHQLVVRRGQEQPGPQHEMNQRYHSLQHPHGHDYPPPNALGIDKHHRQASLSSSSLHLPPHIPISHQPPQPGRPPKPRVLMRSESASSILAHGQDPASFYASSSSNVSGQISSTSMTTPTTTRRRQLYHQPILLKPVSLPSLTRGHDQDATPWSSSSSLSSLSSSFQATHALRHSSSLYLNHPPPGQPLYKSMHVPYLVSPDSHISLSSLTSTGSFPHLSSSSSSSTALSSVPNLHSENSMTWTSYSTTMTNKGKTASTNTSTLTLVGGGTGGSGSGGDPGLSKSVSSSSLAQSPTLMTTVPSPESSPRGSHFSHEADRQQQSSPPPAHKPTSHYPTLSHGSMSTHGPPPHPPGLHRHSTSMPAIHFRPSDQKLYYSEYEREHAQDNVDHDRES